MIKRPMNTGRNRIRISLVAGLSLLSASAAALEPFPGPGAEKSAKPANPAKPEFVLASAVVTPRALEQLAERDPIAVAQLGQQRYAQTIKTYTATFLKQERLKGKLTKVQQIDVRYRESPRTIHMTWTDNADQARRAVFAETPEFINEDGEPFAKVEPAGAVIRLLVPEVEIPIHSARAKSSSRRGIHEFGFASTLDLLVRYNTEGAKLGALDYRYVGRGTIDGRPTLVFHRHLPYEGEGGRFPDAKLIMHIDQEWLLPTAVYAYADKAGTQLLGSYVFTNVKLNPPLTDADFKF